MSNTTPIYGLVLTGGVSRRMHTDKAALQYDGQTQLQRTFALLSTVCEKTFVSIRQDQTKDAARADFPQIVDTHTNLGPLAGITAAQSQYPEVAWLVMACDLPFINKAILQYLIEHRDPSCIATAFRSTHDNLPEPLCTIWETSSIEPIRNLIANDHKCPRKLLINSNTALLTQPQSNALDNVNTPGDHLQALKTMNKSSIMLHVQYFALFREQAGKRNEDIKSVATSPALLYAELRQRYGFKLEMNQLKVAINNEFADWQVALKPGDHVAFIPPVAGG